jgi:hypothetical protein
VLAEAILSLAMIVARSGITPMRAAAPPVDAVPFAGSARMRRISRGRSGRPNKPVIICCTRIATPAMIAVLPRLDIDRLLRAVTRPISHRRW